MGPIKTRLAGRLRNYFARHVPLAQEISVKILQGTARLQVFNLVRKATAPEALCRNCCEIDGKWVRIAENLVPLMGKLREMKTPITQEAE